MKKLLLLLSTVSLLMSSGGLLTACSGTPKSSSAEVDEIVVVDKEGYNPHSFLMTDSIIPERIDYDMDISEMTMMELRLLRHHPFAVKGLWSVESDVNGFYQSKAPWYEKRCYEVMEKRDWEPIVDEKDVKLSAEAQQFVDRIDKRIAELNKQIAVDRDGLKLSNPALTVNMFLLDEYDPKLFAMLDKRNFAIVPTSNEQLFNIYEENEYRQMPNYVTTDLFLQAYHMYFGYVLKSLERHMFTDRIHALNQAMYQKAMAVAQSATDDEVRSLAEFNATYFAIADRLLTDSRLEVPADYQRAAEAEIANIMAEEETLSPLMMKNIYFNYDLFKPRGHYTRTEEQKRYFRAMMWLQTFAFCSEQVDAMKQTVMMAYLLNNINKEVANAGIGVYKTLDFLMGEPDNVSVVEVAELLAKHPSIDLTNITSMATLKEVGTLLTPLFGTRNRITSKIAEQGCENKLNFMPQRYTPDGYVLSRMFDERANSEVPFPRGLHVFSAFGIESADKINEAYYHDADKWDGYNKEMKAVKDEMKRFADWDKSMYNKWIDCLVELQKADKDYPDYMKTASWQRKNLNTALASWAELKHDAILYAEQPVTAECGAGGDFPEPVVVGYVEPNLAFWNKMKDMLRLTRSLLEGHALMSADISERTETLENYIDFCIKVSKREIAGTVLDDEEYWEIVSIGSSLEWFTLSVIDPDIQADSWALVEGADRSIAVCADVFTRNVLGCDKCGILTEATGNADAIYVVVNIGGRIYLTRGAVFSYYEFVNPLGTRYTDEEWQKLLERGKAPARQPWMTPLILDKAPKANERIFYSSGC